MPDDNDAWNYRNAPCGICGGNEFSWGKLSGRRHDSLVSADVVFVRQSDSTWLQSGGRHPTVHRACHGCGAIQPFLEKPLS